MKLVINKAYGGFSIPKEYAGLFEDRYRVDRNNPVLVELVESGKVGKPLVVVEIPDNATDYEIQEYDGLERIIFVVDGRIHHR